MQQSSTDIATVLSEISTRRLVILAHGALWCPNTYVPMSVRHGIRTHRNELKQMVRDGDIRLCCARDLHRQSWRYCGRGRYECGLCLQLASKSVQRH